MMLLSDICLVYIGPNSRTERLGRPKLAEVAHVTRDSDTTFKVKRSPGHQAALVLLITALARQAAAAVGVGTCWP